ncbi:hypothetical protein MAQ5080_03018 [Marinomonas aquimarina]|uniref:Outer membrane protein beta-barrel domain-containing protein n=1 Tax=Marinomonas aquimarina TaxID=295068 RepID=A0A1A8TNU5_9GAMM|nr:outer membrane beta-barrel protein [Marinomonas aquimarina]SBS34927.1 hypothetical protein MAQ5080_03018 [Marinomonas aquimarina]
MKKVLAGVILTMTAASVSAANYYAPSDNLIGGLSYVSLSEDDVDVTVGALVGSIASQHNVTDQFSLVPELRLGAGVKDDKVVLGEVKLEYFAAISVKAQLDVTDSFYVYASPSYAYRSLEASSGIDIGSDSDFGIGAGAGFEFYPGVAAELSYERFSNFGVASFGLKFPM